MENITIKVSNLSKKYKLGLRGYRTLREDIACLLGFSKEREEAKILWALKDISFEVKEGEALGIVGPNRAGKSTILKILAGVTSPTSGNIFVKEKIGALIELSAGLHPELTGKENIYFYGSIMGMSRKEIDRKFDEIVGFSELEEFIDTPIKRYSSGMLARLGFAVASHIDPDILLIDEVLSVGDFDFQNKCLDKIQRHIENNTSIVFVSHNLESVRKLCSRTILLNEGRILYYGSSEDAINEYYKVISSKKYKKSSSDIKGDYNKGAQIINFSLLNSQNVNCHTFNPGERAIIKYEVIFNKDVIYPSFGFVIRRNDRLIVLDTSTYKLKIRPKSFKEGEKAIAEFLFSVNLIKGVYQISGFTGDMGNSENPETLDYLESAITFNVIDTDDAYSGVAYLNPTFNLKRIG